MGLTLCWYCDIIFIAIELSSALWVWPALTVPVIISSVYIHVHGLAACKVIHCACHIVRVWWTQMWMMTNNPNNWGKYYFQNHILFYTAKIFYFQFYCVNVYFCILLRCWIQTGMKLKIKYELSEWVMCSEVKCKYEIVMYCNQNCICIVRAWICIIQNCNKYLFE